MIISALALFTIGGTLTLAIFHFGFHLRDPKNREAVKCRRRSGVGHHQDVIKRRKAEQAATTAAR